MNSGNQLTGHDLHLLQKDNRNNNAPAIICDGIQTPENLGSILRVADAIGSREILLIDNTIDLKNKKLSKLARSTEKYLQITQSSLDQFISHRSQFKNIYALEITTHSQSLLETNISSCDAVIIGHESKGIREELLELCDMAIHIPMYGNNGSMNISHALAVFLYEWRRQEQL